ncbi:MAG TPA: hypothetical protein VKG78_07130 [Opitutaceae bacterium]|nr:hypothetical protein [Opitutaceae bacterium]
MRAKNTLLVGIGALAGVLLLAAGAASSPPVQIWAARRILSSIAGPGATLGRVSVGLNRVSVGGLRFETEGAVLAVPSAEAELGVISAGLGRGVHVKSLVAKGWTMDLARSSRAGAPRAAAPQSRGPRMARALAGMFAAFNLPEDLSVGAVDLEGLVILPDEGGRPMGKARVEIAGGGLAAGRDGRFLCGANASIDDGAAPVSAVALRGRLSASMDAKGTFTRADLRMEATASGRQFPSGIGLSGEVSAERGGGNTSYVLSLDRGNERIASINASGADGSGRFAGAWRLDLKDTDLAPFALGRRLPSFNVTGEGSYDFDVETRDVHSQGKVKASADRLGIVADGLSALGRVDIAADFDFARVGASLRVGRLEASVSGAAPVASVRALQAFEYNMATGELKVAGPAGDLVGISVEGVPLAWLAGPVPGISVGGSDAKGEFAIRAEEGRLALRTKAPLSASGVSVSESGRPVAAGLDVSAFVLADFAPQGWQVQVAPLEVRSEGIEMLSLEARLGRLAGEGRATKAAGSWSARLPALLSQPGAGALPRLTGGDASGSFEASLGSTRELLVKVGLKGLEAPGAAASSLPAITSDIRADFEANGRAAFNIPLHLDYGGRTADLLLAGTISTDRDVPQVDAALSGAELSADDIAGLAALSSSNAASFEPAPAPGTGLGAPVAATTPFWPAVRGRLSIRFKELSLARIDLRDVRGAIVMDPASLRIVSGTASIGDGSAARIDGELKFARGAPRPYAFWTSVAVENMASAPLFQAMDPDNPPAIEGRFELSSHLEGEAARPGDLLSRAQGDCKLSSRDGSFRVLRTDGIDPAREGPSKLADALGTMKSLFGKKPDKIGGALIESATGLGDIRYDQLNISAERGADLDIRLTELALIAPEERITGTGRISFVEGVPIQAQPLSVDLDLGVRGRLGKFLSLVGMLKEGQDELGYTRLYQAIHLGGTLQNVDQSQWRELLVQAPLRKGGGLIDKLLGR